MNWLRYALIFGIATVLYLLVLEWDEFQQKEIAKQQTSTQTISSKPAVDESETLPGLSTTPATITANDLPSVVDEDRISINPSDNRLGKPSLIEVTTENLLVLIDTFGGDIVKVALRKHLEKLGEPDPFILLNRTDNTTYIAKSGLIGPNGTDTSSTVRPLFTSEKSAYTIQEGEDILNVDLVYQQDNVTITKRFVFRHNSYLIDVDYHIDNNSDAPWKAAPYGRIQRDDHKVESNIGFGMQPYLGAATTSVDKNYKKVSFSDMAEETVETKKVGGWLAMVQHYFISAWIPNQEAKNNFSLKKVNKQDMYHLDYTGPITKVDAHSKGRIHSQFYAGPKELKTLEEISPYLDLTIDFSFLWFIAKPLLFALIWIQQYVVNWGLAIMVLTFGIKVLFLYPSAMSYRSMAKMRKLQPLMAELKERYGDDRQKMSSELMKTYRKEKVNPLGGCLPILLQMPVFISLYWALMESVDLRHAPFILWITDLSVKDPYFVLPLIMGVTMFIQQKLHPTPPDPMQAKIMQMMPIFFTALFILFPAGLVLYWVVNNTLSIIQQYLITKQIEKSSS